MWASPTLLRALRRRITVNSSVISDIAQALTLVVRSLARAPVLTIGALVGFGILIPRRHGIDFFDVRMILSYAFIPMLFVAPAVTSLLSPESRIRQSARGLYAGVMATALYGWAIALLFLLAGLVTVNVVLSPVEWTFPPAGVLRAYAVFSGAAVLFVAAISAYVALLFSVRSARNLLRAGFLVLLLSFYAGIRILPLSWQVALGAELTSDGYRRAAWMVSAILVLFSGGLLNALRAPFERPAST